MGVRIGVRIGAALRGIPARFRQCSNCVLVAIVVLLCLIGAVWFVLDLQNRYSAAIADAEASAEKFSAVLAEHTARTFEGVERALSEAEQIRRLREAGVLTTAGDTRDALRRVQQSSPIIVTIAWTNAGGDVIAHSSDVGPERANIGDLPYFNAHRDNKDSGLVIAPPFVSARTGKWVTTVSRRVGNPDGSFAGIVSVVLDLSYFSSTYRSIITGNMSVLLFHRNGQILVREPFSENIAGRSFSDGPLLSIYLPKSSTGSYELISPLDGMALISGYSAVPNLPLVVKVDYARADVLAPLYRHVVVYGPTGALKLLVLLLGAAVIARGTRALIEAKKSVEDVNKRFVLATSNMSQGLAVFDRDLRLVICNERYATIYGLSPEQLRFGTPLQDIYDLRVKSGAFVGPSAVRYLAERAADVEANVTSERIDELSDGRSILVWRRPMAEGGLMTTHEDVTARRQLERQAAEQAERLRRQEEDLRVQNAWFQAALENIGDGLAMFDADERLVVSNERFGRIYGLPADLLTVGTPCQAILTHNMRSGALAGDTSDLALEQKIEDLNHLSQDAASSRIEPLADGRLIRVTRQPLDGGGWVGIHADVTDRHRHEARIAFMAHHDLLTGLANRGLFAERIEDAVARLRRHGEPFTVLMLDLDRFKKVNDTLGHPAGDQLLRETAQRLKSSLRETDVLARLGGDEFAIIQAAEKDPRDGASRLAARLAEVISKPYDLDGNLVSIGTSIGIALAPADTSDSGELMKMADLALYQAKSEGRNSYRFFEASMLTETDSRRQLETELRAAISRSEFELHYQPIIDVKTRRTAGFEALVRWRHQVRGLVLPGEFIPLAEETGLIAPIGEWVLQRACADAAAWPDHLKVAVNLSPVQLAKPGLVDIIRRALADSGLSPARLELEITETALFDNDVDYVALIRQLKNLGLSIALDDFGTGYSSLSYLTMFPFDKIKIDRSFTQNLTKRADCAAIVSAVLALGRGIDAETVAEGVETEQQFGILRAAGVTYVQGYLFGRPCPVSQLKLDDKDIVAAQSAA